MKSAAARACLLGASLLVLTGCVRESTTGQRHEISFQWWLWTASFVIGAALIVAAVRALRSNWRRYDAKTRSQCLLFIILGLMIGLGLGPSLLLHRIVVDPNGFSVRAGVVGSSFQNLKFNNLRSLELLTTRRSGRGGFSRTSYHLKCNGKSGSSQTISLHDAVWPSAAKAAWPLIEKNARNRGVEAIDSR